MANSDIPVGTLKSQVPTEEKKREPIKPAIERATVKKKTLSQKFAEAFVKEDMKSVGQTLLKEKVFPEVMELVIDTISDALSMHFGLNTRSRAPKAPNGYTNYASVSNYAYSYPGKQPNAYGATKQEVKKGSVDDFRSIRYYTEKDAQDVLYSLKCYAKEYDQLNVSVADLYSFSSLSSNSFTDNNWGWTLPMLENVKALMIREDGETKWYLSLPNPIPIAQG